jgi:release factor glutamine methyltransferase
MKIPDNKLSSVKTFFLKELESFEEAKLFFEIFCDSWLGMTKTDLLIDKDKPLSESELLKFLYGIKSLKLNEPVQYVVGETWFYDLKIGVEEGVLIPRPETEELVDWIITKEKSAKSILDIGTGSGCIPLSLKNNLLKAEISGCDISKRAIAIAKNNSSDLDLDVNFFQLDILNESNWIKSRFDVIVSNPPYIPLEEKIRMDENVLDYEPDLALFVPNETPLLFYNKIAEFSCLNLNRKGVLYFEIHEDFGNETVDMLLGKGFVDIELKEDLQGKDRMIRAVLS